MTSITLIGSGAIGCAVAGALVDNAEHDLTIATRTPFDELVVEGLPETLHATPRVLTDPADASITDLVLLATKTYQTEAAAAWLRASCGPDTVVAVLQNGIGQRELVGPLAGEATVIPTGVYFPADRIAPGHVRVAFPVSLEVPDDASGHLIADVFTGSYVDVHPIADFHTTAWTKLVANCGVGAVTTLTRTTNAVLADPEARAIATRVMQEAIAVGRADGAALDDTLADGLIEITLARSSHHISSQATDRLAGVTSEWDARQGEVVRRADRHGIEIPTLRMLTTLVRLGEPEPPG